MDWLLYYSHPEFSRTPRFKDLTEALETILDPYQFPSNTENKTKNKRHS
jgi:hypothetical protein